MNNPPPSPRTPPAPFPFLRPQRSLRLSRPANPFYIHRSPHPSLTPSISASNVAFWFSRYSPPPSYDHAILAIDIPRPFNNHQDSLPLDDSLFSTPSPSTSPPVLFPWGFPRSLNVNASLFASLGFSSRDRSATNIGWEEYGPEEYESLSPNIDIPRPLNISKRNVIRDTSHTRPHPLPPASPPPAPSKPKRDPFRTPPPPSPPISPPPAPSKPERRKPPTRSLPIHPSPPRAPPPSASLHYRRRTPSLNLSVAIPPFNTPKATIHRPATSSLPTSVAIPIRPRRPAPPPPLPASLPDLQTMPGLRPKHELTPYLIVIQVCFSGAKKGEVEPSSLRSVVKEEGKKEKERERQRAVSLGSEGVKESYDKREKNGIRFRKRGDTLPMGDVWNDHRVGGSGRQMVVNRAQGNESVDWKDTRKETNRGFGTRDVRERKVEGVRRVIERSGGWI